MASTRILLNDPKTVSLWSKYLRHEAPKATKIGSLISTSPNAIIHQMTEMNKSAGNNVTFSLRIAPHGRGVTEGETAIGNSEALTFLNDELYINELIHSIKVPNKGSIDQQRTMVNLRSEAAGGLKEWIANRMSIMFFIHVCGYTSSKIFIDGRSPVAVEPVYYGFNKPMEPTSERILRPDSTAATSDDKLTDKAKHKMTLALIDEAVTMAKTANPMIRPVNVEGSELYVMYLHPNQVHQLRTDAGNNQWTDITKHAYAGLPSKNPIFKGSLGIYNGVVLREAHHVCNGVHGTTKEPVPEVHRAVLLGSQSCVIAYGRGSGPNTYEINEEFKDLNRWYIMGMQTLIGMKKTRFRSNDGKDYQDYGVIVVPTYSKLR